MTTLIISHQLSIHVLLFSFSREVLASPLILNVPNKMNWKNCALPKEQETAMTLKFRDKFYLLILHLKKINYFITLYKVLLQLNKNVAMSYAWQAGKNRHFMRDIYIVQEKKSIFQ